MSRIRKPRKASGRKPEEPNWRQQTARSVWNRVRGGRANLTTWWQNGGPQTLLCVCSSNNSRFGTHCPHSVAAASDIHHGAGGAWHHRKPRIPGIQIQECPSTPEGVQECHQQPDPTQRVASSSNQMSTSKPKIEQTPTKCDSVRCESGQSQA